VERIGDGFSARASVFGQARLVPGKTMLWEVAARDGSGKPVAVSGMRSFRVIVDK